MVSGSCSNLLSHPGNGFFETLADCSEREASIFVITLWHIWEVRNAVRNGESEMHPFGIVEKLTAYVDMVLLHLYNPVVPNRCDSHKSKQV